jgi:hypothetical protein
MMWQPVTCPWRWQHLNIICHKEVWESSVTKRKWEKKFCHRGSLYLGNRMGDWVTRVSQQQCLCLPLNISWLLCPAGQLHTASWVGPSRSRDGGRHWKEVILEVLFYEVPFMAKFLQVPQMTWKAHLCRVTASCRRGGLHSPGPRAANLAAGNPQGDDVHTRRGTTKPSNCSPAVTTNLRSGRIPIHSKNWKIQAGIHG